MIDITINGENKAVAPSTTVSKLITQYNLPVQTVIIELSSEILPKDAYDTTVLKSGDCIEIIQFVGGG